MPDAPPAIVAVGAMFHGVGVGAAVGDGLGVAPVGVAVGEAVGDGVGVGDAVGLADGSANGKLTLYCATQVPHHIRRFVSEQLNLPQTAIRLIAPDVGGGFGYKGKHYPEETIIAWAARRLRR